LTYYKKKWLNKLSLEFLKFFFSLLTFKKMQKILLASIIAIILAHYITTQKKKQERKNKLNPKEERVIILGCSSGIGKDCAIQYASRGAKLVLFARREELLKQVTKECQDAGSPQVEYLAGDVLNEQDLSKLSDLTIEKLQGADTVIYCAGMISVRPFLESCGIEVEKQDGKYNVKIDQKRVKENAVDSALTKITTINYFSAVWAAKLFLPMLISTSISPNYLVVSSMAGKVGAPTRALYSGSKHALHGFFDSIRVELSQYNIHIGIICPGTVDTELRHSAVDKSLGQGTIAGSKKNKLSPSQVAKRIILASDTREREVYIPAWFGYIAIWAKTLASPVVDWAAARKYKV
jgi:short-subunit dehydrogenase